VANTAKYVDLIIALQPSMLSWNPPVTGKVGRMVEIYNPNPWMTFGGMGSKKLIGENIEYIANYDSHPRAQFNSEFRSLVKSETAKFAANVRPETAQAVASRPNKLAQLPQSGTKPAEEKLTHSQRDLRAKDHLQIAQAEMPKLQKRAEFEQVADGRQKQQQRQSTAFLDLPIEFGEFGGRVRSAATNNCRSEGLCRENLPWFGYGPVDDNSLAGPRLSRQLRQLQLKNRSEVIHVNLDKFPHIQEILASKIRSAGAISEGREPMRLVVPPSVPIELWDSGLAISAHAGDTLQTIATTYHVPLWTLTQLNKASETAALTEGQRVVIPHSVGQKIPSSLAQNPVSSDATPAGN